MLGKKGFYRHPAFIGGVVGLIVGIVLMFLIAKKVILPGIGICG